MRLLLLSDTHGELGIIDRLAREVRADAVLHAGDFGFYDGASADRLSDRELRLGLLHSSIDGDAKRGLRDLPRGELQALVEESRSLGELPDYLERRRTFSVPVHAVWGNHEDRVVVEQLLDGEIQVDNLHLVPPGAPRSVGPFRVFGLGGNVLPGPKLFDRPLAGSAGKIWATLSQVGAILDAAPDPTAGGSEIRILLTHVSPGKSPLIARLGARLGARFLVSGHMGSPYCAVWNEFTIREPAEARAWLDRDSETIRRAWRQAEGQVTDPEERRLIERGLSLLDPISLEMPGGALPEPPWFRGTFQVNLPDAAQGHAVLAHADGRIAMETCAAGWRVIP